MLCCYINTDILVNFLRLKLVQKVQKETIMKNLDKESINAVVDNYFDSWAVLVYLEETVWRETERGRYYVVKIDVK
jgi:hypothetical protein